MKNPKGNISFGYISTNSQLSDIQMYIDISNIYLRGNKNLDDSLQIELLCFKVPDLNGIIDISYINYKIEKRDTNYVLKYISHEIDGEKIVVKRDTTISIGMIKKYNNYN